jgi:hypothetical protein
VKAIQAEKESVAKQTFTEQRFMMQSILTDQKAMQTGLFDSAGMISSLKLNLVLSPSGWKGRNLTPPPECRIHQARGISTACQINPGVSSERGTLPSCGVEIRRLEGQGSFFAANGGKELAQK